MSLKQRTFVLYLFWTLMTQQNEETYSWIEKVPNNMEVYCGELKSKEVPVCVSRILGQEKHMFMYDSKMIPLHPD